MDTENTFSLEILLRNWAEKVIKYIEKGIASFWRKDFEQAVKSFSNPYL